MPEQPRASRLFVSVRRSITPKRHARSDDSMLMYSTPQERQPSFSASFRDLPDASARPTVEQIAMGLHVSRTPHLRHHPRSASYSSPTPSIPPRSSLKKQTSASTSTVTTSASLHVTASTLLPASTSTSPRLPQQHGNGGALSSLKSRMARLLPGERRRSTSAPPNRPFAVSTASSAETLNSSSSTHHRQKTRKAVRFEESSKS
ncbi:hypothetical protein AN958_07046 [Leucoagaricus sp. SymC.cos]|nr:hypothetical protein AN958_07046 [Leucoagaricus sp. SymC.cos]